MAIRKSLTAVFVSTLIFLSGCAQPVYNVVDAPVVTATGASPQLDAVKMAIVRAGTTLGWSMRPVRPGLIEGRLALRTHVAEIDVTYDTKSYDITYRDSVNLDYDGKNIHRNYNGWIMNLDRNIRNQLLVQ